MPHNNRMSTSNSLRTTAIWQNAIGHDPYANADEKQQTSRDELADKEKIEKVMGLAKSQNVTDGAKRNDFTAKLYLGLKRGKQRRADAQKSDEVVDHKLQGLLEAPSSSSEEEFVEVEVKKEKKRKSSSKKSKRKRHSSSSSSESSSSDESDRYERKRRRERQRRRKKKSHKRRSRDYSDDSSDADHHRRHRSERRRRKDDRKRSGKGDRERDAKRDDA